MTSANVLKLPNGRYRFDDTGNVYSLGIRHDAAMVEVTLYANDTDEAEVVHQDKFDLAHNERRLRFAIATEIAAQQHGVQTHSSNFIKRELLQLSQIVATKRAKQRPKGIEHKLPESSIMPEDPEPWNQPVDGEALLDAVVATSKRYVTTAREHLIAQALYCALTHVYDAFHLIPNLAIVAPALGSGKSTNLTVIEQLVARPLSMSNITPAALYRLIEEVHPTLLIDEAETFLKNIEFIGILNGGLTRSKAFVFRAEGDKEKKPKRFSTFGCKVFALNGSMHTTLSSRSI